MLCERVLSRTRGCAGRASCSKASNLHYIRCKDARMAELVDLVVLARVVERGSFARAAADLGLPPSTLSRRVAALERRLGVRVLERTTPPPAATEIGELLAERGRACGASSRTPSARWRITSGRRAGSSGYTSVPTPVADTCIGPALAEYLRRYLPTCGSTKRPRTRLVDLVTEGFDAALRIGRLTDSALGAVRLAVVAPERAAAPRYLDRAPPAAPGQRDLATHSSAFGKRRRQTWTFVGRSGATEDVELVPPRERHQRAASSRSSPPRAPASRSPPLRRGAGRTPRPRAGRLQPLSPPICSVVTPSARISATKVRAFVPISCRLRPGAPRPLRRRGPAPGTVPDARTHR